MNNTERKHVRTASLRWQDYLYTNNIICNSCYKSGAITCGKCKDAVSRHVMSGEAAGWDDGREEEEEREEVREPQFDYSDRD